uniref:long-chain-fatty-acid--CoA ligase n=1 Tax=Parascaris equorum TaxID=6256 RepID=A0A914RNP0_PAREQ
MPFGSHPLPNFPKFTQYSRILPGPEHIHQSILIKPNEILEYPPDRSATTIFELLQRAIAITDNGKFIGELDSRGDVQWIRYKQVDFIDNDLYGVSAGETNRVGIAGLNSSRYMITQYALISYSIIYDWDHITRVGSANLKPVTPPSPSSIYMICHTSGTTGKPKGVQLSHRALLASMAGLYVQWCMPPHSMSFDNSDIHLSFLSLAHIYEQLLEKLFDDMAVFRPTIVALVPRLLNQFHERILQEIARQNPIKRLLFEIAVKSKLKTLSKGEMCFNTVWDKLVFSTFHARFGGNLRLLTTGGGHVGGPAAWAEKSAKVPFLRRGAPLGGVMKCGHPNKLTKNVTSLEAIGNKDNAQRRTVPNNNSPEEPEEHMNLGHVNVLNPISFNLAQGDFVSPEQVENIYLQHPIVKQTLTNNKWRQGRRKQGEQNIRKMLRQVFVYGSPQRAYLVAIVVVDVTLLRKQYAAPSIQQEKTTQSSSTTNLLSDVGVRRKFLLDLRKLADEFTPESGLLTSTLKVKRSALADKFAENIEQLYSRNLLT